jgi:hypothetical protein
MARHGIPSALTTNAEALLSNSPKALEQVVPQTALKAAIVLPEDNQSEVSVAKETTTVPLGAEKLAASATGIPDDIRPLVQQQLEAVGTQRLAWHGEVWPQQSMEWEIEGDSKRNNSGASSDEQWATSLKLTTPALGAIAARLQLGADGVRIVVSADEPHIAARLRAGIPALEQSMSAAGINLLGMLIWSDDENQPLSAAADPSEPIDD